MTIKEIQAEIINEVKGFDNWMDKNSYLIKLGKEAPSISPEHKTEKNIIRGCQVTTWFYSELKDGKVFYEIDSMSMMIKGIISLLIRILSGQKPEDIKTADLYFIDKIDLSEDFSPLRANSLFKLVNQMKSEAAFYEAEMKKGK